MLTYREALTRATSQLSAHPDLRPTALADASTLLQHMIAIDRATLIAHPERLLTLDQLADYQSLITRRLGFEPIQYIVGSTDFYGLNLRVSPAVLIPRPETELLVEAVVSRVSHDHPIHLADVGTGSGAIAIALAHTLALAHLTAFDFSPDALAIARENARTHSLADRITFLESDLLATIEPNTQFDAIVSNPPYIPVLDSETLHPQVRDHEPARALFAGTDGLEVYRRLIPQAFERLKPGGQIALEIGYGQREALAALLADWHDVEFLPDLQGIARIALAIRP